MKYDKRGKHPNSLRNLKPRRKGQPSLNPDGRRGKGKVGKVPTVLDDPAWQAYVRKIERDAKWLDRLMRKNIGCSLDQADRMLRKR